MQTSLTKAMVQAKYPDVYESLMMQLSIPEAKYDEKLVSRDYCTTIEYMYIFMFCIRPAIFFRFNVCSCLKLIYMIHPPTNSSLAAFLGDQRNSMFRTLDGAVLFGARKRKETPMPSTKLSARWTMQ